MASMRSSAVPGIAMLFTTAMPCAAQSDPVADF